LKCEPVPPGAAREESPPGRDRHPLLLIPKRNREEGRRGMGAPAPGGEMTPPGAEKPGEGSSGVSGGPAARARDATKERPSDRLWGVDLDSSSDMEVEEMKPNLKRKGREVELRECSVSLAPPPPNRRRGRVRRRNRGGTRDPGHSPGFLVPPLDGTGVSPLGRPLTRRPLLTHRFLGGGNERGGGRLGPNIREWPRPSPPF